MPLSVTDLSSNAEENIAHAAKIIGRSSDRRNVFAAIYTGKQRIKTAKQISHLTRLSEIRVLQEGKKLADNHIVTPTKIDHRKAYEKIDFFHAHKKRILALAISPSKLKAFPTKRNPASQSLRTIEVRLNAKRHSAKRVTIDVIDSFSRVRKQRPADHLEDAMSEKQFKAGLQSILRERGRFQDWGGETSDLFTTRLRFGSGMLSAAFALKGPGTKGKLTPGKMGKNGDQIQRLIEAPAEMFLIQYCRQIEPSVLNQLGRLATAKSVLTGDRCFYGIIDGVDSTRLVKAYPEAFAVTAQKKNS